MGGSFEMKGWYKDPSVPEETFSSISQGLSHSVYVTLPLKTDLLNLAEDALLIFYKVLVRSRSLFPVLIVHYYD